MSPESGPFSMIHVVMRLYVISGNVNSITNVICANNYFNINLKWYNAEVYIDDYQPLGLRGFFKS